MGEAADADLRALVAEEVARALEPLRARLPEDRASLVVFSGDLDRVIAAFVIAVGAASAGLRTSVFFTFWGLAALRRADARAPAKGLKQRLFAAMTPAGSEALGTSRLHFFGLGARLLRSMMAERGIASLEELIEMARELDVQLTACTMSMDAMGIAKEELVDGVDFAGVASFVADAARSRLTLFL